jgi:HAD superfamily hydrolase (TIGR01509 family)
MIVAVIFDLDGVIVDSEGVWDEARRRYVDAHGGVWEDRATRAMMGMSSNEWSRYVRDELGVDRDSAVISADVAGEVGRLYRQRLPLLPGAVEAVRRMTGRWPLGLASSSNREVIDLVLELAGLTPAFSATVSSEEVGRGKPAPDVYLEAARRLDVDPESCVAIEDSHNGIRSAHDAGMAVVAAPNAEFPPDVESLELADVVLGAIAELGPEAIETAAQTRSL